jgi:EAL domain-containing protein (putative c-di-GMP-specific phosphodiesterase class I)
MIEKAFPTFYGTNYEFSINLTLSDILDEDMNRFIMRKLKDNPESAKNLVFEILESEGIENYKDVMIFIEEVKDIGCKIAIDDFGSGYSNFEHILRLDVDYIKIDASLIKNLDKDVNAQIITRTIANFARKLGLKTISEYVHSKEVYEKAVGLGVDYSQGFYFGEPKEFILKPKDFLISSPKVKIIDTPDYDDVK